MIYCRTCILPNTRPNLKIDNEGNCNCSASVSAPPINWDLRKKAWKKLVAEVKRKKASYDCVIPVSGGKDSTWQVLTALRSGLKPLAVTWKSPARNKLGKANLENLINLGVDHIDFSINPKVEKKFIWKAFKKYGSPAIPMHMAIHAIPMRVAVNFRIPLILWGENSAYEYGGDDKKNLKGIEMTKKWFLRYGLTHGTYAEDWASRELKIKDLEAYKFPSQEQTKKFPVKAVFLGQFFPWDPVKTFKVAKRNGFKAAKRPLTGFYNFADVDDSHIMTIHHWMKWYKFGFTRLWDNLSQEIRKKRISRSDALRIVLRKKEKNPRRQITEFCKFCGVSKIEFYKQIEKFRNKKIWQKSAKNKWKIKNFILPKWKW